MGGGLERSHASAPGLVDEGVDRLPFWGGLQVRRSHDEKGGGCLVASGFFSHLIFRQLIKDGLASPHPLGETRVTRLDQASSTPPPASALFCLLRNGFNL